MDPPIVNESSFSAANPSSYSLAEIWPFPLNGNADGGGLGLRMGSLTGFGDAATNRDASVDESTVTDQSGSGKKPKDAISEDESSKLVSTCSDIDLKNSGNKRKVSGSKDGKTEETGLGEGNRNTDQKDKPSEPPKDYIHVRARRGQATDSHSLAERARREKISERMKILQDLVPGCNKVIGKALVLDEIINYIQSLQRQVEFLSMKLEAVNSRPEPIMEGFPAKSMGPASFDAAAGMVYGSAAAAAREYSQGTQPDWLHMQVGSSFERAT